MPIITKPSPLEKDATGVFSLDKTALALHPLVVASTHFSSPNVWDKIIVKYKSETLGQFESVEFDATLASPKGQFFVSSTAEDIFEIEKITIVDKDGAILLIPRAELTVAEFDINFSVSIPSSFLSISSQEIDPGLSFSWGSYEGNFYTQSVGAVRVVQRLSNSPVRAIGFTVIDGGSTPDGMEWVPTSITISGGDTSSSFTQIKTFTLARSDFTADTLKYLVLDSDQSYEFYQITFNSYDKTYGDSFLVQGQVSLHQAAPAVQAVTWNVAGKTGVGTVTTGANGLITKSGGGDGYNVNVLSNETITGDGYVEFINSSSFINVIFGLAEVNDPSGFFNNIIIGGYHTGSAGLEKVYNDGTTFFYGGGVGSIALGDILRFGRVGTTYYIKINGTQVYSITNSNTNPVKASVTIYAENFGVNGTAISL